jgi:hypothetical protein
MDLRVFIWYLGVLVGVGSIGEGYKALEKKRSGKRDK